MMMMAINLLKYIHNIIRKSERRNSKRWKGKETVRASEIK